MSDPQWARGTMRHSVELIPPKRRRTMNRWVRYALLLWLTIAGVIVLVGVVQLLDSRLVGTHTQTGRSAAIDGAPASLSEEFHSSIVERSGEPAWKRRTLYLVPAHPSESWRVVEIVRPFHMSFVKPDGSQTGPHRVDFFLGSDSGWHSDGKDFSFLDGLTNYPKDASMLQGRHWNTRVLTQYAAELVGWILLVGLGVAIATLIVSNVVKRKWQPHICRKCGYDLRGARTPGCPECGAGRTGHRETVR